MCAIPNQVKTAYTGHKRGLVQQKTHLEKACPSHRPARPSMRPSTPRVPGCRCGKGGLSCAEGKHHHRLTYLYVCDSEGCVWLQCPSSRSTARQASEVSEAPKKPQDTTLDISQALQGFDIHWSGTSEAAELRSEESREIHILALLSWCACNNGAGAHAPESAQCTAAPATPKPSSRHDPSHSPILTYSVGRTHLRSCTV